MKSNLLIFLMAFCFTVTSCSKDAKPDPGPGPGPDPLPGGGKVSTELLRRVQIDVSSGGGDGTFQYNTDSTVSEIVYSGSLSSSSIKFHYNNLKWIDFIEDAKGSGRADYYTDSKARPTTIYISNAISTTDYKIEFVYTGDDKVSVSKLYWVTGGVSTLKFTTLYEYNTEGFLTKITSTSDNNYKIVYTLENYSAACNFNPWVLISATRIEELYELFNYPVLRSMKTLPGKVTKTTTNGVERILEQEFSIDKGRLNKVKRSNKYPGTTGQDFSYEINFFY